MNEQSLLDFAQAMGESFCEHLCPPIPFEEASAHECCQPIWNTFGRNVTPASLASLTDAEMNELSVEFGRYFEVNAPALKQIRDAVTSTLARCPIRS